MTAVEVLREIAQVLEDVAAFDGSEGSGISAVQAAEYDAALDRIDALIDRWEVLGEDKPR